MEWQPIETAPKDGQIFVGCQQGVLAVLHWCHEEDCWLDWDSEIWMPAYWLSGVPDPPA